MKKNDVLYVKFRSLGELKEKALKVVSTKKKSVTPKNTVYFESPSGFRSFMTLQKIEILIMVANQRPKSLYELSNLLNRPYASILRDCNALEETRFIKLKQGKESARQAKEPSLAFNYSYIIVELPNSAYNIGIAEAA